ncbi:MAG TPA: FecR domain-containing protein [Chitinophaga sp.]
MTNDPKHKPAVDWERIHQLLEQQAGQPPLPADAAAMSEAEQHLLNEIVTIRSLAGELQGWEEVDTPAALAELKARLSLPDRAPGMMPVWRRPVLRYAAVIALLAALAGGAWLFFQHRQPGGRDAHYLTLEAPAREMRGFTLPDGTQVWLNAGSRLRYPAGFGKTDRQVEMSGEACFSVTPGAGQPFTVHTQQQTVQVLGTLFNINAYGPQIITTLSSGKIAVGGAAPSTALQYLSPGQQAIYDTLTGRLQVSPGHPGNALAWKDGQIAFTDEPLPALLNRLGILYGYKVTLKNNGLDSLHYNVPLMPKPASILPLLHLIQSTTAADIHLNVDTLQHTIAVE